MNKKLAFVFGGGGSHGALQVGAMVALLEGGFQPDLLVGTSIGAANAAFIALDQFSKTNLDRLSDVWREAASLDLLPSNYYWLTFRTMLRRSNLKPAQRIREFFISQGITPEVTFSDLPHHNLVIVSSDLYTGQPVLHGGNPDESILDALLLSTALPPWVMPVKKQDRYLMDGSVVSNLPIEPALNEGATHIVALDLLDTRSMFGPTEGMLDFLDRLYITVEKRQSDLEIQLAISRGIPLLHLNLIAGSTIPFWDFQYSEELIDQGHAITQQALETSPEFSPK
ncbi:MAG TPA: patatin-like phospholipase family protein [Anaerolineales bacterium]|jgi:NTE family protein